MRTISSLLGLLTRKERYQALLMVVLIGTLAVVEIGGLGAIFWFFQTIVDENALEKSRVLSWAYQHIGFTSYDSFQIAAGLFLILVVAVRNVLGATTLWVTLSFSNGLTASLASRLLDGYLKRPYEWYLERNAGVMTRNVAEEIPKLVTGFIVPALRIITDGTLTAAIILTLVVYDPTTTIVVGFSVGAFGLLYTAIRRRLGNLGQRRLERYERRFRIANEALSGVKSIKTLGRESYFTTTFNREALELSRLDTLAHFIKQSPRFLMELVGFLLLTTLALVAFEQGRSPEATIGMLVLYGAAGMRLMPAINRVLESVASMRFTRSVLHYLEDDIRFSAAESIDESSSVLTFDAHLELKDVGYRYPGGQDEVLRNISVTIPKNAAVGFVGPTGSGKTTAVDLVMGLLVPSRGEVLVDGLPLAGADAARAWRRRIGYVPQEIYLLDRSIAENIALGEGGADMDAVRRAARLAKIDDFIETSLPEKYNTLVGDRGVKLSGGQRQRLGIARALYRNPDILVFDEATSALDTETEEEIAREIDNIKGKKTIIVIAHRPSTVRRCDMIYRLENGEVADSGSFDEVEKRRKSSPSVVEAAEA